MLTTIDALLNIIATANQIVLLLAQSATPEQRQQLLAQHEIRVAPLYDFLKKLQGS